MSSVYISVASWEPRFALGIEKSLQSFSVEKVIVVFSNRSSQRTASNRQLVSEICQRFSVELEQVQVDFEDQIKIFRSAAELSLDCGQGRDIYFDISTSPRDVSIILGRELVSKNTGVKFVYYPAESYGNWLSKEAGPAKIVVGASGLMYPDKPTCVLALCANSTERLEQVYNHFEPSKMLLLWDPHRADYGIPESLGEEIKSLSEEMEFSQTDFSVENCEKLLDLARSLVEGFNLMVMSTGPKLGIVHIMNVVQNIPEVGAAYIPSRFYNDNYSFGIAEPKVVSFPFKS